MSGLLFLWVKFYWIVQVLEHIKWLLWSSGWVFKVSATQPSCGGFEPYIGSRPWFLIWQHYWLVPGSGLKSDLYKLRKLDSQSSYNKYVYYIPTINTANFTQLFYYQVRLDRFLRICSCITLCICKSLCIHMRNSVTLVCYE